MRIKKIIVFFLAGIFISGTVLPEPKEKVIEVDLGRVSQGEVVTRDIVLDKTVRTAVALCDCLSFTINESGGQSLISVSFDSTGYSGETEQELIALSRENKIRIKLRAQVE